MAYLLDTSMIAGRSMTSGSTKSGAAFAVPPESGLCAMCSWVGGKVGK